MSKLLPKSYRGKLLLLGILVGLMVLVNSLLIFHVIMFNRQVDTISYPTAALAKEMQLSVIQVQQFLSDISATRAQDGKDDGFKNAEENANRFKSDLKKIGLLRPEKVNFLNEYGEAFDSYYEQGRIMAQTYISYGPAEGNKLMPQFDEQAERLADYTDKLSEESEAEMAHNLAQVAFEMKLILGTLVISGLFTTLLCLAIARNMTNSFKTIANAIEKDSAGYITVKEIRMASTDEFGDLARVLNTLIFQVQAFVKQVGVAIEQLAASSEELTASAEQSALAANHIASSISDVAAGANEQLHAANETTAVVEQMSASMNQVAANVTQMAAQTVDAVGKAKGGSTTVERAVAQMNQVEEKVNTSAQVIEKLGERSHEIGQIVDTIAGIASQTNLLALNAAIEAARAGEQGRGFAVVAEEVRKLAEQSQEATKKIAELIGEIQGETDKAVIAMNDGTREVKTGTEVIDAAGVAFREIATIVTQVSEQVREISLDVQKLAVGSQQIVSSVKTIDGLGKKSASESQTVSAATEEQLASMEEIATSSESLSKLAQDIKDAVAKFRI